jgi:hypothetical protein
LRHACLLYWVFTFIALHTFCFVKFTEYILFLGEFSLPLCLCLCLCLTLFVYVCIYLIVLFLNVLLFIIYYFYYYFFSATLDHITGFLCCSYYSIPSSQSWGCHKQVIYVSLLFTVRIPQLSAYLSFFLFSFYVLVCDFTKAFSVAL